MGQQQLLLLVLSTVIVGLATVAGIQAFSENQAQATQDALTQRSIDIASKVLTAHNKPSRLGGVDITSSPSTSKIANVVGLSGDSGIDADGAGDGASCDINTSTSNSGSYSGSFTGNIFVNCSGSGAEIEAGVDADAAGDKIETIVISTAN